jgi:hypothetical protein
MNKFGDGKSKPSSRRSLVLHHLSWRTMLKFSRVEKFINSYYCFFEQCKPIFKK